MHLVPLFCFCFVQFCFDSVLVPLLCIENVLNYLYLFKKKEPSPSLIVMWVIGILSICWVHVSTCTWSHPSMGACKCYNNILLGYIHINESIVNMHSGGIQRVFNMYNWLHISGMTGGFQKIKEVLILLCMVKMESCKKTVLAESKSSWREQLSMVATKVELFCCWKKHLWTCY